MAAPPSLKIEKSPYLGRGLIDFDEIWHGDAVWPCSASRPLKFKKKLKFKMAAAAILKNRKITISRPWFDRFWTNLAWRHNSTLRSRPTVKSLKFWKSKMATAAILKNRKIAVSRPRFDQFWRNLTRWRSFALALMQTEIPVTSEKSNLKGK